ncbi:MAG: hypothetical protein LQ346_004818 [Caloplaca aetnensis]|nr:MAG: hypothetical protein LQ346_004818 [Caloplaca aetnensis]
MLGRLRPRDDLETQRYKCLDIGGKTSGISYLHSQPQLFLDRGCCLEQDLRKLVFEGVPSEDLYGLVGGRGAIDLGYDLFKDYAALKSRFNVEDIFHADSKKGNGDLNGNAWAGKWKPSTSTDLASLENRMSITAANSFFHLYNYFDWLRLAKRGVQLLASGRGSLILGCQVGSTQPGEYTAFDNRGTRYAHDVALFRQF